ncbi:MAG: FtsQ-type POTRA domain-containing protein [Bacillota bacterium]|nr:FtsQ-type POTRA domain-containing protein [Bacillota bacterium]
MAVSRSNRRGRSQRSPLPSYSSSRGELRKRKQKRKRKNSNWIWKVILLMILCLGVYFFLHSGLFTLKTIEVEGNHRISDEDIIVLADITTGGNIFDVDREKAEEHVALHALVDSVDVKTRPFHKILIQVQEKEAIAWLYHEDDGYYLVDENGNLLEKREEYNDYLPLISGVELPKFLCVGMRLETQDALEALKVSAVFADFLRDQPREITVSSKKGIIMILNTMELRLGDSGKLLKKRHLIEDLMDEIPASDLPQVEYMDVSSPRKPVLGGYDLEAAAKQRQEQKQTQKDSQKQESGSQEESGAMPEENPENPEGNAAPEN